jgi:hypothetical protein
MMQALSVMVWLAVVLAWFVATVLRGQRQRFAVGALVSFFVAVGVLNVVVAYDQRIGEERLRARYGEPATDWRTFNLARAQAAAAVATLN